MVEATEAEAIDAGARVPAQAWWMVFVLFLFYVNSAIDRLVLTMMVEPIKADLHFTDVQMGVLLGPAFAITFALFGLPLGWAADRFSRRWVLYLGVTFWSLATSFSGLSRSFGHLLVGRICVGVGEAALLPAAYSLMGDNFPRRRLTTAMAFFQTGSQVGAAVAFAAGGLLLSLGAQLHGNDWPLIGQIAPWQFALLIIGAPSVLLALLVFTFTEGPKRRAAVEGPIENQNIVQFARTEWRLVSLMLVGFGMIMIYTQGLIAWVPTYLSREYDLSPSRYGSVLAIITLIGASAMIMKGWIVDWLYGRGLHDAHIRFFTWLLVAAMPISIASFFVHDATLFMMMYGIVTVLITQFVVYVAATVQLVTPRGLRSQAIAGFTSIFGILGFGLGPVLTAAITDWVFKDESALGYSLALQGAIMLPIALVTLRMALREVGRASARLDKQAAPPLPE